MKFHLLVSTEMKPIPHTIQIVEDYGKVTIRIDDNCNVGDHMVYTTGDHMIVEGDEESIKNWLKPFNCIWIGDGHPCLQSFYIVHIEQGEL